jgi:DNA-binding CsgD family transcriptional regulator
VSRLLRCLAERRWPLVPRHQRQSVSFRQRAPLNRLEMRMIDATMKGQSVHQMAATLGINRKRVYNGLERIKVNFRLVSHSHFHHFMTDRLSFSRLSADLRCLTTAANATLPPRAQPQAGGKSFILFERVSQIVLILAPAIKRILYHIRATGPLSDTKLRNTTMKFIKTFVAVAALSLFSAASFAQSVSATASTLDRAEAKIAAQAAEQGASYKIPAPSLTTVHMTAELSK